jgi:F-type H+/Na+-transporting ATPase subunit alpha
VRSLSGILDNLPLERIDAFRAGLAPWLAAHCPEILSLSDQSDALSQALRQQLRAALLELSQSLGGR